VIGSYLISSINDGEGTIKNVYVSVGYAFSAFILFLPVLTVVSHVLTTKEEFIYRFSLFLIIGYTLILIFLSVKETHCYTPKKTIAVLLLTIGFMIIAVLACIILYILWKDLLGFVSELFEEVKYRAFR
jgi:heme/copper-type cytochrome/quinol oxidase subunit 4